MPGEAAVTSMAPLCPLLPAPPGKTCSSRRRESTRMANPLTTTAVRANRSQTERRLTPCRLGEDSSIAAPLQHDVEAAVAARERRGLVLPSPRGSHAHAA